ncbi:helix-turn-helix domain-containing protein [Streptomyces hokutonensis]|nr:LysR family transcriptional regulator [Streptomyces hokutonensis]
MSFLAVVDTGSFGAAAEATHRSQPRVSMRQLGCPQQPARAFTTELA